MRSLKNSLRQVVYGTPVGRALMIVPRVVSAARSSGQPLLHVLPWAVASREYTNFSYETTDVSRAGLCGMVAVIANADIRTVVAFADELRSNAELAEHVRADHADSDRKWTSDAQFRPGRQMLYYLLVRALKCGFVVEAGVDKGLGAAMICQALRLNAAEGHTGDYLGIENNPLQRSSIYARFPHKRGEIRHGNSPDVIHTIARKIDLFVHETTPDPVHVRAQLEALQGHMADRGVFASPWALPQFIEYAARNGKNLLMHQEKPDRHWYSGARLIAVF
jgi:Methyltransferase domain